MNFRNILHEIEKTEPEVYEQVSGRREVLKSFGAKVAVAALPFAIGSLFNKAYGKTTATSDVIDALNFELELEYFQYTFYRTANNTGGLIPATDLPGFQHIEAHEKAHIKFLIDTITNLGGIPFVPKHYTDPTTDPPYVPKAYDFTKGGVYPVFSDYPTFLMMAQVFEDTGIRAYNGQLATFIGTDLFFQMQQIAATEGRHAAHPRLLRRLMNAPEVPAPWITNDIAPNPAFLNNYEGENNGTQMGVVITNLADGTGTVPQLSATAAFDEPLDKTTVMSLFTPFILP